MPSMPLRFWNDPDGARYREAYFTMYPDVWRHGDWITITDTGGVIIQGRSDSTLNRHGIRMGRADIIEAPGVPHTRTGRKLEVPLKRIMQGATAAVVDRASVDAPELIDWYVQVAAERSATELSQHPPHRLIPGWR